MKRLHDVATYVIVLQLYGHPNQRQHEVLPLLLAEIRCYSLLGLVAVIQQIVVIRLQDLHKLVVNVIFEENLAAVLVVDLLFHAKEKLDHKSDCLLLILSFECLGLTGVLPEVVKNKPQEI